MCVCENELAGRVGLAAWPLIDHYDAADQCIGCCRLLIGGDESGVRQKREIVQRCRNGRDVEYARGDKIEMQIDELGNFFLLLYCCLLHIANRLSVPWALTIATTTRYM